MILSQKVIPMATIPNDKIGSIGYIFGSVSADHFKGREDDRAQAFMLVNYHPDGAISVRLLDGVRNNENQHTQLMSADIDARGTLSFMSSNYYESINFKKLAELKDADRHHTHWPIIEKDNFMKIAPTMLGILEQMKPENYLVQDYTASNYNGANWAHPTNIFDSLKAGLEGFILNPAQIASINMSQITLPAKEESPENPAPVIKPSGASGPVSGAH